MISKNKVKRIKSLTLKKFRQKDGLFIVEGDKNVSELLHSDFTINELYATQEFLEINKKIINRTKKIKIVNSEEIKKISLQKQPQNSLAICQIPSSDNHIIHLQGLSLFLDNVQDPGNLGTIIRICDWFGIEQLFCSHDTADLFNPKVIQASMGSFCRVKVIYIDFNELYRAANNLNTPVYTATQKGNNIYKEQLPPEALVVLGNEGKGINTAIAEIIEHGLNIPSFRNDKEGAESLNVAVAAGIICSEFKRRANPI